MERRGGSQEGFFRLLRTLPLRLLFCLLVPNGLLCVCVCVHII